MNDRSERSDDLNILPPTDASQTMAGVPRESALAAAQDRAASMLKATPDPQYQTTPQGMQSAAASSERSCQVIVSGYELLEEIGRGGMGVVFRARNLGLMRDVAVKLLQDRFPINGSAAERFLEEARITGQLQHPGIPPVHQVGRLDGGRPYLAMKLIKGQSLAAMIDRKADMNVIGIFEQICQTLGYAHANKVIHRDLKPANVMVGAFGEVQVMDWGLAKVMDRGDAEAEAFDVKIVRQQSGGESDLETKAGSFLGTPAFMPPEQARGEFDAVGPHSDVFGLGAILCMMLTGKPPFKGMDANSTRMLAGEGKIDEAFKRLDECGADPEVVDLCKKCLAFKPEDRFKDGSEVAATIAKMRAESEDRARQAEVEKARVEVQAEEERKRQRVKNRLTAAIVAITVVLSSLALWQMLRAIDKAELAQRKTDEVEAKNDALRAEQKITKKALVSMTDEVIEKLFTRQPQLEPNQKTFLENVIRLYDETMSDSSGTDAAKAVRAEGRRRIGSLYRLLTNLPAAEAALVEARDIRLKLLDTTPNNPEYRDELAKTRTQLGNIYEETGRPAEALKEYGAATEILELLALDVPKVPAYRANLASAKANLASFIRRQLVPGNGKQVEDVDNCYTTAQELRQKLLQENPGSVELKIELAGGWNLIGSFDNQMRRFDDASKHYAAAQALLDEVLKKEPRNEPARVALARLQNNRGNLAQARNQPAAARTAYTAAVATFEQLVADFPGMPEYRYDYAQMLRGLALLNRDTGKLAEARPSFEKAHALQAAQAARYPEVTRFALALHVTDIEFARQEKLEGATAKALERIAPLPAALDALIVANPNDTAAKAAKMNCLFVHAEVLVAAKDAAGAQKVIQTLLVAAPESARNLVNVARLSALASAAATDDTLKEELAKAAVGYLTKAKTKGAVAAKDLAADTHYDGLRQRDDFKALLK